MMSARASSEGVRRGDEGIGVEAQTASCVGDDDTSVGAGSSLSGGSLSGITLNGQPVDMTLVARDEAGQEGVSETVRLILPERDLKLGVMMALVGAPVFLHLIWRTQAGR